MGSDKAAVDQPDFDPSVLDPYTGGDVEVRDQVLELFLDQAELLITELDHARGSTEAWMQAAHSLKGCARNVGANAIADLAFRAERRPAGVADEQAQVLEALREAMTATSAKVKALLGGN
jgi:HPt (histidine-containing phosphotransfer) domain-containing protein